MLGETESFSKRNPGEVFRQYLSCMLRSIDATLKNIDDPRKSDIAYRSAADLAADLRTLERGLADARCEHLSTSNVAPLRHMVNTFGFRTASLDLRENTTVTNNALAEIWQTLHQKTHFDVPDFKSDEWKEWVIGELMQPLRVISEHKFPIRPSTGHVGHARTG